MEDVDEPALSALREWMADGRDRPLQDPSWERDGRVPATALLAGSAAGLVVFAALDLLIGLTRPGPQAKGFSEIAVACVLVLGHAGLVGLAVGVGVAGLCLLTRPIGRPGALVDGFLVAGAAILAVAAILIHVDTFDGPRVKSHPRYGQIVWGFRIGAPLAILVSLVLLRALTRRLPAWSVVSALAVIGAACLVANTRVLVGLYPGLHAQLVITSAFALTVAAVHTLRRRRRLQMLAIAVAIAAIAGSLGVRATGGVRSALTLSVARGPSSQEYSVYTEPIFRRVVPVPELAIKIFEGSLTFGDPASERRARAFLDEALPDRGDFNVLMIAVDTLRFDHTGFNGYERNTTPHLDRLAADRSTFVFERAYTPYPTSNFAYSSTLTGLYPRCTPAYSAVRDEGWTFPATTSLPAALSEAGWRTIGVTAFGRQSAGDPEYFGPLRDGFSRYNDDQTEAQAPASHITTSALKSLARWTERPYFLWAHYLDPHEPYLPHEGHDFGDAPIDRYDSEIACTDQEIGRLLDGLRERGELEKTIVIAFADHGEEFREHGKRFHNTSVYEQQIHVPLLVHVPGLEGRRITTAVSLVDLLPTVLSLVGVEDTVPRQGRSLLTVMLAGGEQPLGWAYSEFFGRHGGHLVRNPRCVVRGPHKLIWNRKLDTDELYDVDADPLERRNLIGRRDDLFTEMRGLLQRIDRDLIDPYHQGQGTTRDPRQAFLTAVDQAMADVRSDDREQSTEGHRRFKKLLFDYAGDPSGDAAAFLGEDGLDELSARLISHRAETPADDRGVRRRLEDLIVRLRRPNAGEFLREQLKTIDNDTPRVARALAWIGDGAGRDLMRAAMTKVAADLRHSAVGLAHLGDPAALPWIAPVLSCRGGWEHVADMISALPHFELPHFSTMVRDYVLGGLWTQPPLQRRLASVLPRIDDDQARWLLVRMATSEEVLVAETARGGLERLGVGRDQLARLTAVADAERDADGAVLNLLYDLAFENYDRALALSREVAGTIGFNPALKLRYARYLALRGKTEPARDLLEAVRDGAPLEIDRHVATRRLAALELPARIEDPSQLGVRIENVEVPAAVRPMVAFPVAFKVTNTGGAAWQGGYWQFFVRLLVRWKTPGGKLLPLERTIPYYYLPARGVLPGESLEVLMLGLAPRGKTYSAHPVIVFEQPWLKLPEDGVVYVHPTTVQVDKKAH